jgi:hypothetical protein
MYYLEHNKRYCDYLQAQSDLNEVLEEYMIVFQRTQPKGNYSERISGSPKNKTEEYVIELDRRQLNRRIADAKLIIQAKKDLLDMAEEQLRKSKDIYDVIYTKKFVDKKRPKDIYRELDLMGMNYSRSHIYEIIKRIRQTTGRTF